MHGDIRKGPAEERIEFLAIPDGVYWIGVRNYSKRGDGRFELEIVTPEFTRTIVNETTSPDHLYCLRVEVISED
jgi:hypothetical protein